MFFYAAKKQKKSAQSTANHSHVSSTYHLISRCHIQNPNTPPKKIKITLQSSCSRHEPSSTATSLLLSLVATFTSPWPYNLHLPLAISSQSWATVTQTPSATTTQNQPPSAKPTSADQSRLFPFLGLCLKTDTFFSLHETETTDLLHNNLHSSLFRATDTTSRHQHLHRDNHPTPLTPAAATKKERLR